MSIDWKRALRSILTAIFCAAIWILLCCALWGCKTQKVIEYRDSVRIEYQEKLVPDTVTIEVPAEEKERETRDSTSYLETSMAESLAKMTWKGGVPYLFHNLKNKPQKIKKVVYTKQRSRIIYRTRYVTRTKEVPAEISWWNATMIRLGYVLLFVIAGAIVWLIVKKKLHIE